ncbi:MAG: hypothetical protein KH366_23045 [Clostridiaceae bacterium]|nr:hypothetical protein [Clostridiaceae bacterium]
MGLFIGGYGLDFGNQYAVLPESLIDAPGIMDVYRHGNMIIVHVPGGGVC